MILSRRRRIATAKRRLAGLDADIARTIAKLGALGDPAWQEATVARCVDAVTVRGVWSSVVIEAVIRGVITDELDLIAEEAS